MASSEMNWTPSHMRLYLHNEIWISYGLLNSDEISSTSVLFLIKYLEKENTIFLLDEIYSREVILLKIVCGYKKNVLHFPLYSSFIIEAVWWERKRLVLVYCFITYIKGIEIINREGRGPFKRDQEQDGDSIKLDRKTGNYTQIYGQTF